MDDNTREQRRRETAVCLLESEADISTSRARAPRFGQHGSYFVGSMSVSRVTKILRTDLGDAASAIRAS